MANELALKGGTPVRTAPFPRWPIVGEAGRAALLEVFDSGIWSFGGPREKELARRWAELTGARFAHCVSNGTVSLEIALRALGIGPGDEVIVPALTWYGTAWAVQQVGAVPVFADVGDRDWCLEPAAVRAAVGPHTRAVIPVHLYDQVAEMDALLALASELDLRIVEDCAHAHGSEWGGVGVGTLGDVGSFSFQQSKSMTSGEGGMLVTNDEQLSREIYGLKNCGRPLGDGDHGFGGNQRITEFQAAVLLPQLDRLEEQLDTRQANLEILRRGFAQVPGVSAREAKPRMTRQGLYGAGLRIDPKAFGGLPTELIARSVQAEGVPIEKPYAVVYRAPAWKAGLTRIRVPAGQRPERVLGLESVCPVAERISEQEGLVLLHHLLLGPERDTRDIVEAIAKVQAHAAELRLDSLQQKARGAAGSVLRRLGIKK